MPAIWQPQICAATAIVQPAPHDFAAACLGHIVQFPCANEVIADGDWHLVLRVDGRHLRLWIRGCAGNPAIAALLPSAVAGLARLAPTRQLLGLLSARPKPSDRADSALALSERWRLAQWLRLLDAIAEEAPPRAIAAALMTPEAARMSAAAWDASSERRRLARWRRQALALRDGGYRALLMAG